MIDDEQKIIDDLSDERRQLIDDHFAGGTGLFRDVINIWAPLPMCVDGDSIDDEFLEEIKPLPHYEEYIGRRHYSPAEVDYIFQKSSLEAITKFDALIDEYNADLARIKKEKNGRKIMEFVSRAEALFAKPPAEDG